MAGRSQARDLEPALTGSSDADGAQPEVTVLLVDPHPKPRAALAGGSLDIASSPSGTVLRATFPVS